jgi:VanZ family protein
MWNDYLRAFVIGSSYLVFVSHFLAVGTADEKQLNYTYKQYTFVAPVYLGLMNMISLFVANAYNLSRRMRYVVFGSVSPLIVSSFSYLFQTYTYSNEKWITYFIGLFIKHFIIFNVIIYSLDKYII